MQEATASRSDGEETAKLRKQVDEQRKQLEELRRNSDQRAKQIEERQRAVEEAERQAKKRKEALDQLDERLKQQQKSQPGGQESSGGGAQMAKQLAERETEIKKLKEDSVRAQSETERLLQLMQMTQEEQFAKEKTIMELQEYINRSWFYYAYHSFEILTVLSIIYRALKMERSKRAPSGGADDGRSSDPRGQNRSQVMACF